MFDVLVLRAVNRKQRRRQRIGVVQRAGHLMISPLVLQITAQPQRQHQVRIHAPAVGLREVGRPIVVHHRLHLCRLLLIRPIAVERPAVAGQPQHQNQMTSRRSARGADVLRVNSVLRRIGPQKADRRLHILHRGRKLVTRRQPVAGRRGHVAPLRQFDGQRMVPGARTRPEPAAMNAQHRGKWSGGVLRPEDIHGHAFAYPRVLHVKIKLDVRRNLRPFHLRSGAQRGAKK